MTQRIEYGARVLVYAGIDEAGYGPTLGPLCVACSAFVLPDHDPASGAPDLWNLLARAVGKAGCERGGQIAIDDSKKLKGANDGPAHPLKRLERGVLAFAFPARPPADDAAFFRAAGAQAPGRAWYDSITALPVANAPDLLRIDGARLFRALGAAGVSFGLFACEAIDAAEFNEQVDRMGSKATVNFCAAMRLLDRVWRTWPHDHPRVIIDRQGGRTHYREELQLAFPGALITILAEEESVSRYRLVEPGRSLTVTFTTDAEGKHLPVALASMTAKYVRELFMIRLNRFFRSHLPELKSTAGYALDARRYLKDIAPLVRTMGVARAALVRQA